MNLHEAIEQAAALLREGQLVAFPTETVYGLGGNALSDTAVASIYAAKGRPDFNPLIVHVTGIDDARKYARFSDAAQTLAAKFWPGPLTLVLPRAENCALSLLVSAGMDTVALRCPAHPLAQALLQQSALPIAAPSANRSGRISPTEAQHVYDEMGDRVAMVLDGGPCEVGIESTVVSLATPRPTLLRPGLISTQALSKALGQTVAQDTSGHILAPGMLASHYAPDSPVRLNANAVETGEVLLAFGPNVPAGAVYSENLSISANLTEAAANLFRMLRRLDACGAVRIAVMSIPEDEGLGCAINDRLRRAASPR